MLNEHDVKFDSDVILAVSVMTQKEKAYIVKSSLQRLSEISNLQIPSSGEALLPPVPPATTPNPRTLNPPPKPGNSRGRPPQIPQQPQVQRMQRPPPPAAVGPRIGRPRATTPAQQPLAPVRTLPQNFPHNQSISISVVDQSVKCDQCKVVLKNSSMLADHMKTTHLSRFSGLCITTPTENNIKKRASLPTAGNPNSSLQIRPNPPPVQQAPSKRPRTVETPIDIKRLSMLNAASKTSGAVRTYSPQTNRIPGRAPQSNSNTVIPWPAKPNQGRPPKSVASPIRQISTMPVQSIPSTVEDEATLPEPELPKPDPVIKCNTCTQFVKQSVFKSHKLSHMKEESKEEKVFKVVEDKEPVTSKPNEKVVRSKKREEKQIDFVDIADDSDDETTIIAAPQKLITSERNIPCPTCDKKLATNMALKMHMNLKHPVKSEAVDTEQLLAEETDEASKEKTDDKIRNEVENMETLELLDNLVNFLNEA